MNNYPNFINYNGYPEMNMYNNKPMKKDNNTTTLYDPYNGFIRGNMFKDIYDPYKIKEPYEIKPMNEQADLLTYIDALGFAMTDLNLYLDVHPNSDDAIKLFNQYRKEKEDLTKEYESKYGPLTLNSESLSSYPWSWNDMPWPWDN